MFDDRRQAGEKLAELLGGYKTQDPVVYALPRGGLPVGAAIAERLNAPLDLVLVRKLGAPGQPELAIGAVADGAAPACALNEGLIRELDVSKAYIDKVKAAGLAEIDRRRTIFFRDHAAISPKGRCAILVDDGLATGATMEAAVKSMRQAEASKVIVAVPVAPADVAAKFERIADAFICVETPYPFYAVGAHYGFFPQLDDTDVLRILAEARKRPPGQP